MIFDAGWWYWYTIWYTWCKGLIFDAIRSNIIFSFFGNDHQVGVARIGSTVPSVQDSLVPSLSVKFPRGRGVVLGESWAPHHPPPSLSRLQRMFSKNEVKVTFPGVVWTLTPFSGRLAGSETESSWALFWKFSADPQHRSTSSNASTNVWLSSSSSINNL